MRLTQTVDLELRLQRGLLGSGRTDVQGVGVGGGKCAKAFKLQRDNLKLGR